MRSISSVAVKVGRVIPPARIASAMAGPWFHIAAATKIGEPYCLRKSRVGPTKPPAPPPFDRVTPYATLRAEKLRAGDGVLRRAKERVVCGEHRRGKEQEQSGDNPVHGPGHQLLPQKVEDRRYLSGAPDPTGTYRSAIELISQPPRGGS